MNKTFNRGRLLRLARTGKLLLVGTGDGLPVPVELRDADDEIVPGRANVSAEDFSRRGGSAHVGPTGTVTLTSPRHSGPVTFEFRIVGETLRSSEVQPDPAPRFTFGQGVKAKTGRSGLWLRSWVDNGTVKHLVSEKPKRGKPGQESVYEDKDLQPA